jgi:hypothetical protein
MGKIKAKVGIAYNSHGEGNYRMKVGNDHPTRDGCFIYIHPVSNQQ